MSLHFARGRRLDCHAAYRGVVPESRADCGPVRLAWATAADFSMPHPRLLDDMGACQRARFAELDGERASRFLLARSLLAELIGDLTPGDIRVETVCPVCGSRGHGRLRTVSGTVAVSVSYAGEAVIVAAAQAGVVREIGVDIEDGPDERLTELTTLFTPHEPPSRRDWTAIEAAVKADGRGVRIPPAAVVLHGERGRLLPNGRLVSVPDRVGRLEVAESPGPAGFIVSVAIDPASGSEP